MKKNYFNPRNHFAKKQASLTCKMLLLLLFFIGTATAQVSITKPSLSFSTCTGFPTSYSTLGNIVITETGTSNFSTGSNITLILSAPANFEFKASTGSVSYTNSKNIVCCIFRI